MKVDTPFHHWTTNRDQFWLWRCSPTAAEAISQWVLPGSVWGHSGRRVWRPEPQRCVLLPPPPAPAPADWTPVSFQCSEPVPPALRFVSPGPTHTLAVSRCQFLHYIYYIFYFCDMNIDNPNFFFYYIKYFHWQTESATALEQVCFKPHV